MNADPTDSEFRAYWDAHRPDPDDPSSGRCKCGGEWVWFDPENVEGCEIAGPPPVPEGDEYVDGDEPVHFAVIDPRNPDRYLGRGSLDAPLGWTSFAHAYTWGTRHEALTAARSLSATRSTPLDFNVVAVRS